MSDDEGSGEELDSVISVDNEVCMASNSQKSPKKACVDSTVLIKQYMDNEISFDELTCVMERQSQADPKDVSRFRIVAQKWSSLA